MDGHRGEMIRSPRPANGLLESFLSEMVIGGMAMFLNGRMPRSQISSPSANHHDEYSLEWSEEGEMHRKRKRKGKCIEAGEQARRKGTAWGSVLRFFGLP